ncbi:hypothetical protein Mal48_37440 [Thalassoglobus polymorphus]|uniref:Uncharacterized protein n=1 Tax=Thalassoglobus polymorphus TaxID=2527994 RepID=A0A517QS89_9PLAN|nr:hypothetical protein Mal48_37440 [Thalassoglobus polymorphus]
MNSFVKAYSVSKRLVSMPSVLRQGCHVGLISSAHALTGRHSQWTKRYDPFY